MKKGRELVYERAIRQWLEQRPTIFFVKDDLRFQFNNHFGRIPTSAHQRHPEANHNAHLEANTDPVELPSGEDSQSPQTDTQREHWLELD